MADSAELVHLQDAWGHQMLREGKYGPAEIDSRWSKEMIQEFNRWVEKQGSTLRMKEE